MTKFFKIPFAVQGDRVVVPDEPQADGSVSYNQGYGYDYERDQATDPAAKDIEREKMNALFHDLTEATGEIQQLGVANWSADGKPYPVRAMVYYDKRVWQSVAENNNEEPGTDKKWVELKADASPVDSVYPVGIVTWFAQNRDPNTLFPGTTWSYIGENRTIRLAAASGADVMTTGGADSITLAAGNIPSHTHTFSGTTSTFDYGTKTSSSFDYGTKTSSSFDYSTKTTSTFDYGTKATNSAGNHSHANTVYQLNTSAQTNRVGAGGAGMPALGTQATGDAGAHAHTVAVGAHNHTVVLGAHSHTIAIGSHNHTVPVGAHNHTVSGTTGSTGAGAAFSVTNSFIKLMAWYRSA